VEEYNRVEEHTRVEEQSGEEEQIWVEEQRPSLEETLHTARRRMKVRAPAVGPVDLHTCTPADTTTTPRPTVTTPSSATTTSAATTTTPGPTNTAPAGSTTTPRPTTTPAGVTTPKSIFKRSLEEFDLSLSPHYQVALNRSSDSVAMARARLGTPDKTASPSATQLSQRSDSVILTRQRLLSPEVQIAAMKTG
jgi:hypothetical protein